jgi:hypothetical protein
VHTPRYALFVGSKIASVQQSHVQPAKTFVPHPKMQ